MHCVPVNFFCSCLNHFYSVPKYFYSVKSPAFLSLRTLVLSPNRLSFRLQNRPKKLQNEPKLDRTSLGPELAKPPARHFEKNLLGSRATSFYTEISCFVQSHVEKPTRFASEINLYIRPYPKPLSSSEQSFKKLGHTLKGSAPNFAKCLDKF